MIIDPDKHNPAMLRALLRGRDPLEVMKALSFLYDNQNRRIQESCEHLKQTGDLCGQCREVIDLYKHASEEISTLRRFMKKANSAIKLKWSRKLSPQKST